MTIVRAIQSPAMIPFAIIDCLRSFVSQIEFGGSFCVEMPGCMSLILTTHSGDLIKIEKKYMLC